MDSNSERSNVERLARCIMLIGVLVVILLLCWLLRSVIAYILVAAIISLMAKPVMGGLKRIKLLNCSLPLWFCSAVSLLIVLGGLLSLLLLIVPIVSGIIRNISVSDIEQSAKNIALPLSELNIFLREHFTSLGRDFRLELAIGEQLTALFSTERISSVLGSAASFITNFGIGLFAVVFIGFFFIKDELLFTRIVCALVPDRLEERMQTSIRDIEHLLSRYFIGVVCQILGVALVNFIGLILIARLGFKYSIGIAFLVAVFNLIPYIGPLIGGFLGTLLGLVIRYSSATPMGVDVSFGLFAMILIIIFCITQLVDNYIYQPLIYSTSIKSTPLEIFFVMLIVGNIGGALAMVVAIPIYTVFRVVAYRFFGHIKVIRKLIPSEDRIVSE